MSEYMTDKEAVNLIGRLREKGMGSLNGAAGRNPALAFMVCICMVVAIAGGFVCGWQRLVFWLILVFSGYTDIVRREIYVFPIRIGIVVEMVGYVTITGNKLNLYVELLLCITVMVLLSKLLRAYAEGDLEIFIMLVLAAAVRGENTAEYTLQLLWLSCAVFVLLFSLYVIIYNIHRLKSGKKVKLVTEAPMVPAIAAAFLICCIL